MYKYLMFDLDGTLVESGDGIVESAKHALSSTVLPPSEIPDDDSTNVVMVEVPSTAPTMVPMESASKAPFIPLSSPFSSSIFALEAQPISVPRVSNTSTKRKANITTKKSAVYINEKSSCPNVGASDAGIANTPDGNRL